jgi:hypothetical protein
VPNLSDSCRVDRLPFRVKQSARDAGMQFPLSLREFIRRAPCRQTESVNLHLKFLFTQIGTQFFQAVPDVAVRNLLVGMRTVYNTANIAVRVRSREDLRGPAFATLVDLDVGTCLLGGTVTAEQTQLFGNRNNAGPNDIVIYFVRTANGFFGCANHPAGRPGAVVASVATQWTLAHEVGHVLGLIHCDDPPPPNRPRETDRLMTGGGTNRITNPPPDLIASEVTTMQASPLTPSIGV